MTINFFLLHTLLYFPIFSATYVCCLLAVESYWPESNGVRDALTKAIKQMEASDVNKMYELALWVRT